MPWAAIIPAVAALGGAAIGAATSSADRNAKEAEIQKQIDAFASIGVPPAEATQIVLSHMKSAGKLTPEMEQAFTQGKSKLSEIAPDQQSKEAQLKALQTMQQLGTNGGELLSDKAALNNTMNQIATKNRGSQQAILAGAKSRGQLGSGQSLAAQLDAAQNDANQANQTGLSISAMAQQRALDAIKAGGQLGGQMRSQDYAEKSNAAEAQDAIDRFNTANRQGVAGANVNRNNSAQQYNLANDQSIDNQNTAIDNYQQEYNQQQKQRQFEDQMQQAAGETGQMKQLSDAYGSDAKANSDMWGNIGSGIAKAGAAYANSKDDSDQKDPNKNNSW